MNVNYFKFETEEQANECLALLEETATIDIIGTINKPTEEVDEEGNPIYAALEGYHVNVIASEIPEDIQGCVIEKPSKPHRIFLGQ